ncbi:MAG: phosphoribosylanthranilate isomerase [Coxiellaceae bacterium]|nr:phosphoribosylanthranilate isomerase [Coxiellaceae bacterium]
MKTGIKICGITDPEIAKNAVELGANYIGLMCYEASSRFVDAAKRKLIVKAVKKAGGIPVLVFVDADAEEMAAACDELDVEFVQLHGNISRNESVFLPDEVHRIYVLHVDEAGVVQPDVDEGLRKLNMARDCVMYDGLQGGSGRRFHLDGFSNIYPMPFFLAGGLAADNVVEAIQTVHPDAVDVSSGVEDSPGVKSIEKIKAFIDAVRSVP